MAAAWRARPGSTPGAWAAVLLEWAPTTHRATGPAARTGGTDKFNDVTLADSVAKSTTAAVQIHKVGFGFNRLSHSFLGGEGLSYLVPVTCASSNSPSREQNRPFDY